MFKSVLQMEVHEAAKQLYSFVLGRGRREREQTEYWKEKFRKEQRRNEVKGNKKQGNKETSNMERKRRQVVERY